MFSTAIIYPRFFPKKGFKNMIFAVLGKFLIPNFWICQPIFFKKNDNSILSSTQQNCVYPRHHLFPHPPAIFLMAIDVNQPLWAHPNAEKRGEVIHMGVGGTGPHLNNASSKQRTAIHETCSQ